MACADDETLARFERGQLTADERGVLLDHAAECAECRAAISVLVATASPEQGAPGPMPERTQIGRYALGAILGRGAMGVVHAARDPELDRDVAVKLLRPQASALRLRREAQALAKLAHPNVVRVYDVGEDDGQTFIAMELVDGDNLRQWLGTARTTEEILGVLVRAGRGLAAAHAAGLVHRDFKPDNVLIARTGEVMVGDFGLARSADPPLAETGDPRVSGAVPSSDALTATGTVIGTPAYMAPEQVTGDATAASDQFAYCATAWEALFGRRPFEGATLAELVASARTGTLMRPPEAKVPRKVEAALRRGLLPDPEARYPSTDALLAELAPAPRRARWLVGGALVVAAAGAATIAATMATRAPAVDCAQAAALLDPVWSPARADALAKHYDPIAADAFGRYATDWRAERVEACRATHERHEQSEESLGRRVACLDRARDQLALTIGDLLAATPETLPRADEVVTTLPSLARCTATLAAAPALTFSAAAASAALDVELTQLAISLAGGSPTPSLSLAEAGDLRMRAEAIGHEPQILRARMLEARLAAWAGERAVAEAGLREVMVRAEASGDDFSRAQAGGHLAFVISTRPDEATAVVTAARAALRRAGADPAIEQLLLEAEVAIAKARGNERTAAELQARVVAMIEARTREPTSELVRACTALSASWALANDPARWAEANAKTAAAIEGLRVRLGVAKVYVDGDPMELVSRGDFAGSVAAARAAVAQARAQVDVPYLFIAQMLTQVVFGYLIDMDFVQCHAAYREADAAWSLPLEKYAYGSSPADTVYIAKSRVTLQLDGAACLRGLGRYAEQLATLERARELAIAGGAATAGDLPEIDRARGIVLVELGRAKEGRALLEPIADDLGSLAPVPRASARFALARALWQDGGLADRPRAVALAADAVTDLDVLVKTKPVPALRKVPVRAAGLLAEVRAWQAAHRLD